MLKRPHYITLGLVVLMTLIVLNLPVAFTARLKQAVGSLFLPLFGLSNSTHQLAAKAGDAVTPRGRLLEENEGYRKENEELKLRLMQAEQLVRDDARLRQLLGWKQQSRWNYKLARVIVHDPANFWRTVHIDLGSRDGVRENLPVLTSEGLVGRVSSVSLTRSQVVLLGDPNCKVAALIRETGETGVISPNDPLDTSLLRLVFPFRNANLKAGQQVTTSGLGGVIPAGIPVGIVVDWRQVDYGLYTEARIKLNANLNALADVWVLFP
jgi:rod shape-determining protein MreC